MKKNYLLLLAVSLILFACSGDDNHPVTEPDPQVFHYVFSGNYQVEEMSRYLGPTGGKVTIDESYLTEHWSFWESPSKEELIIDLEQETVFFSNSTYSNEYGLSLTDNDLSIVYDDGRAVYFGTFSADKSSFSHYFSYYIRCFMPRPDGTIYGSGNFHRGTHFGKGTYNDHFYINGFPSPADMDKEGDEIFWANIVYEFRLAED